MLPVCALGEHPGGKDHYAADRAEAERLLAIYPPLRDLVQENRAFVTQAVTWAVRQEIGQFIDLGAGLPASPAVHQTARVVLPSARVAYVDIDPVVLSHARALLTVDQGVTAVSADLRDPAGVGRIRTYGPSSTWPGRPGSSSARSCTSWTPMPPGR
jgi:hypothetical protein